MRPASCELCSDRFSPRRSQLAMCIPGARHPRLLIPRLTRRRPRGSLPIPSEISLNYSGDFRTDRVLIRRNRLSRVPLNPRARRIDRWGAQSEIPLALLPEFDDLEAAATRSKAPSSQGSSPLPSGGSPKRSPHCWSPITDANTTLTRPGPMLVPEAA
jgi:hypothetical protein